MAEREEYKEKTRNGEVEVKEDVRTRRLIFNQHRNTRSILSEQMQTKGKPPAEVTSVITDWSSFDRVVQSEDETDELLKVVTPDDVRLVWLRNLL